MVYVKGWPPDKEKKVFGSAYGGWGGYGGPAAYGEFQLNYFFSYATSVATLRSDFYQSEQSAKLKCFESLRGRLKLDSRRKHCLFVCRGECAENEDYISICFN